MSGDLGAGLGRIEAAFAKARAFPLSVRKTLLTAVLLDNFCDDAFEGFRGTAAALGAEDVLAFREAVKAASPAQGLLMALCAMDREGPRLALGPVDVPLADYPKLSVEDYMVSLYNKNTVQRVLIVRGDDSLLAHEVLGEALAWWRERVGRP